MAPITRRITAAVGAVALAATLSLTAVAPANAAPVQAKPVAAAPVGPMVKSWWVGTPPWVACVALIGLRNGAWAKCTF